MKSSAWAHPYRYTNNEYVKCVRTRKESQKSKAKKQIIANLVEKCDGRDDQ